MESKKINQLATNVNPQTSDLTTIGDPITGQLKKITWLQVAHLIGAQAAVTLQQVTDNGNTTTDPITTAGLTLTNLGTGVPQVTNGEFVSTYGYGLANGVATLDSGGKIPASQLPSSVMEYKGTWNASTNTPTLADGTGDNGDVYLVNVAGSQNLGSGTISFAVGDWVVYNGTIWQKSLNSNAVASVFGRTGTIVAQEGDYNIDQLGDVAITSAATNDYLRYNGSSWVNTQFPTFVSSDKLVLQVRNNSGATINKGTVVYINGATAGYPTIAKAQANQDSTSAQTLGLVQDNISNNSNGIVVLVGQITGIDTSAYPAGTQLYLSGTTAGAFTSTKTLAPTHLVYVGIVTAQNAVNGVIEVKIQNGYELEEIHDVSITSVANNHGLFYESSTDLWKNKSIATVLGYTPEQPLTFSSPLVRTTNTISIPAATGSVNGYLTSTDWTTFNNKLTSPMTTLGDIIYGGASGTATRLAGNTTTTKQYLSQTGTGTASAAPSWATIAGSDITGAALTETDDTNVTLTLGGTPSTALLRAVSLTLGWTGTLAVSRGGTGAASFTAGQILYGNGTSAISSSSQFTFSPTAVFFINNTISAGGIAMNLTSTVNAAANNDILYGVRISPTFSNGAFTGVTQRALGVFGDTYINGTITGAGWGGAVIGSNYGGAGSVNGILKANGSGVVSAAVAGTDYQVPLTNPVTGTGSTNILAKFSSNGSTISNSSITDNGTLISSLITLAIGDSSTGSTGINIKRGRLCFSSSYEANHSIYNNYLNIDGEGVFDGMKMNVYDGLKIRTGQAATSTPTEIFNLSSTGIQITGSISSTSTTSATAFIPTASTVPTNGMYLSAANTLDFSTNSTNRFSISSSGSASFLSAGAGYGLSVTNVEDSSQGLLVRSTDNDTTLYLARFQSSVGATSQTWIDRFSIAKNGSTVIGDNIPAVNVRLWVKGEDQTASNYAMDVTDSLGQSIAWFRNDKAIRFYGGLTATSATFSSSVTATIFDSTSNAYRFSGSNALSLVSLGGQNVVKINAAGYWGSQIVGANDKGILIDNVGNVGIGTTSPTDSIIGSGTFLDIASTSGGALKLHFTNATAYGEFSFYKGSNGSFIDSAGAATVANNDLIFRTGGTASNYGVTERMRITSGGAVQATNNLTANSPSAGNTGEGIIAGTSFKIDAGGTGQKAKMFVVSKDLSDTYGSGLQIQFANQADDKGFGFNLTTAGTYETYVKDSGASWIRRMIITQGGNIGINTSSAGSRLTVYEGDIRLYKQHVNGNTASWRANILFTDEVDRIGARIVGLREQWDGAPMGLTFETGGVGTTTERMSIKSDGLIYLGSAASGAATLGILYYGGGFANQTTLDANTRFQGPNTSVAAAKCYAWNTYSDIRIKKDIEILNYGLNEILKLNPVSYKQYDSEFIDNNLVLKETYKNTIGLIAQEVSQYIKEAVGIGNQNELWGLDYNKLIPVIIKAIQEQQIQIKELKSKLA